jgi:ABC-2 type transport system ATP-binding protein
LLHEPDLLVLDEPANSLDPAGGVEIRELLRALAMQRGITVFMSSHILGEVDRIATRIGIVHQGRLIEELDSAALERHRDRRLEVGARDVEAARRTLLAAGLEPILRAIDDQDPRLEVRDRRALEAPDEVAALLAAAGVPPTHLAIARETLEDHFMRLTGGGATAA